MPAFSTDRTFKKEEKLNDLSESPYFPQLQNPNIQQVDQMHAHQNINFYIEDED